MVCRRRLTWPGSRRPEQKVGAPGWTQTSGPELRRLVLYSPELRAHGGVTASGLSPLIKDHLAGGASRLAALLLPQILPVFSVVAPCHPGAALRDLVLVQRGQATSVAASRKRRE